MSMVGSLQFPSRKLVMALLYHPERSQLTWVILRVDPCHLDVLGRLESPEDGFFVFGLGMSLAVRGQAS
jgi:hypothetical protein